MLGNEFSEIGPYQVRMHLPDQSESNCSLNLNEHLIQNPESTFFLRFQGNSIQDVGIFKGDILVVDRSKPIQYGNLVIVVLNGIFTIRRLAKAGQGAFPKPNLRYPLLEIDISEDLEIWGTVSSIIHTPSTS